MQGTTGSASKNIMWSLACGLLLSFTGLLTSGCFGTDKKDKTEEVTDEGGDEKADKAEKGAKKKKKKKKKGKKDGKAKKEGGDSGPPMDDGGM